jgi:cytochrome c-type biogenesis protein CcmH/NrfG
VGELDGVEGEPDAEDLAALYAMVTPSVHADMIPDDRRAARPTPVTIRAAAPVVRRRRRGAAPAPVAAPVQAGSDPWKRLFLGTVGIVAVAVIGYGVINFVGGSGSGSENGGIAQATPQPAATAPAVDTAKVADLMTKLQANPNDTEALLALADEYYAGQQFAQAGEFLDMLLAIEPEHIQALLARGATYFNVNDLVNAETTWQKVVAIDPKNVEVHYDLGFLYLNQATPDWAGVQREWNLVIELDPDSTLAKTVQSHLDSLVSASMLPAATPSASAPASDEVPSASPAASPAESPAASTTP